MYVHTGKKEENMTQSFFPTSKTGKEDRGGFFQTAKTGEEDVDGFFSTAETVKTVGEIFPNLEER
jgi:hypothetical protein